jgi:hypothetical protein
MERRLDAEVELELREWADRQEAREAELDRPVSPPPALTHLSVAELEMRIGDVSPQSDTNWEFDREVERERIARQHDEEYLARYADEQRPGASW